jgi:hypothetical protein
MFIFAKDLTRKRTGDRPETFKMYSRRKKKMFLTFVPLQLGKAANCSRLDYLYYNLIPGFKKEKREG